MVVGSGGHVCGRVVGEQRKRARARCQRGRGHGTRGRVHRGTVTRWKGKGLLAVSFAFSQENGSCLFHWFSHGGGIGDVASVVVLCCVMLCVPFHRSPPRVPSFWVHYGPHSWRHPQDHSPWNFQPYSVRYASSINVFYIPNNQLFQKLLLRLLNELGWLSIAKAI